MNGSMSTDSFDSTGNRIVYGLDSPPPTTHHVRVGMLAATFESGWLRWIRFGGVEVLRGIYGAVRDPDWKTIEPVIQDLQIRETSGALAVSFMAVHQSGNIDFRWRGSITIEARGSLVFEMDGHSQTRCLVSRIGICVLHPETIAGQTIEAETAHGVVRTSFPEEINPDRWLTDLSGIRWRAAPGLDAHLALEGDLFEIEDQRNWTDASFKTFNRSLRLPWPYPLAAGERIRQVVRLDLTGRPPRKKRLVRRPHLNVTETESPTPALGTCLPSDGASLTLAERATTRVLAPAHVRAVIDLGSAGWPERLGRARDDAAAIGTSLELEVVEGPNHSGWNELAAAINRGEHQIDRVLAFGRSCFDTTDETFAAARTAFACTDLPIRLGGGSRQDFAELNRTSMSLDRLDFVTYPICPQMHAFDASSMIETIRAQAATARQAGEMSHGRPVVVGPIALRPLAPPTANIAYRSRDPDPRQMSLLAAAWLVGSIDALSSAGVSAITYFDAAGQAGLMDRTGQGFARWVGAGAVFPAFHVFRAIGGGGQRRHIESDGASFVRTAAIRKGSQVTILVANVTFQPHTVTIRLPELADLRIATLDRSTAPAALVDPLWLEHSERPLEARARTVDIGLSSMAITMLRGTSG